MSTNLSQFYQCDRCSGNAFKHVDCGLLIVDALEAGGRISSMPYVAQHQNLCASHLNDANITYVHYNEHELGRCSII